MYEGPGDLKVNRVTDVSTTLVRREVRDRHNTLRSTDPNSLELAFINIKKNWCDCHAFDWLVVRSLKFISHCIVQEEADRSSVCIISIIRVTFISILKDDMTCKYKTLPAVSRILPQLKQMCL